MESAMQELGTSYDTVTGKILSNEYHLLSIAVTRIESSLERMKADVSRMERQVREERNYVSGHMKTLIEMTENRFLWTILTVLASNVMPLIFHALNLL